MEKVRNLSNCFYVLKKKIKNEDLMNLISKSNKSIYNILFKKEEERSI